MTRNNFLNTDYKLEESEICHLSTKIRSEFIFKLILQIIVITFISIVNMIHLFFIFRVNSNPGFYLNAATKYYLMNPTINWIFFSSSLFLIIYFSKRAFFKVTPSVVKFVETEMENLGLKLQRRYKTEIIFLILNGIGALFILMVDFGIIHLDTIHSSNIFQIAIIGFLSLSIIVPIGMALFQNKFRVKLKGDYSINLKVDYPIIPRKKNPDLLDIQLISNPLSIKSNRWKFDIYKKISEDRWLTKSKIDSNKRNTRYNINPFIFFKGYSTPLEFQNEFLNVALAIKEWDEYEDCERLLREKLNREMQKKYQDIIYTVCLENRFSRN